MNIVSLSVFVACANQQESTEATPNPQPKQVQARPPVEQKKPEVPKKAKVPSTNTDPAVLIQQVNAAMNQGGVEAFGSMNITATSQHTIHSATNFYDYDFYPASNAVVLQGVVSGPIGNIASDGNVLPLICITATKDEEPVLSDTRLEIGLAYPVDNTEGTGDRYFTIPMPLKKTKEKRALLGANSMELKDVNGDGQYEVVVNAQWLVESNPTPVNERIVLKVTRPCKASEYCDAVVERLDQL